MKKLISALLVLVAFSTVCFAQDLINFDNISYGARLGANLTNIKTGTDANIGFELGGVMKYMLNEKFSIVTELNYAQAGNKETISKKEIKTSLAYIQVPVLCKYMVTDNMSAYGGAYLGYKISEDVTDMSKDMYRKLDYGLVIGGCYSIDSFAFDLRYSVGLLDINADTAGYYSNSAAVLSVGYKFSM